MICFKFLRLQKYIFFLEFRKENQNILWIYTFLSRKTLILQQYMKFKSLFSLLFVLIIITFSQCKKTRFTTDPGQKLNFSNDTIRFDTVFSQQGSATRAFLIYNTNKQPIKIAAISLGGGNPTYYQLNVDGVPGQSFTDVEIPAKDSIYVFVEVNIDPANRTTPLIVDAEVIFEYNGNTKKVYLESIGQDVIVFRPKKKFKSPAFNYSIIFDHPNESQDSRQVVGTDTIFTWTNQGKPFLIFDYLVIDSLQRLYIEQGCKIYFHNSSGLWAYRGSTLKVKGTKNNPVTFKGDRLDKDFIDEPGQWDRIWLNDGSDEHEINYAIIKNAYIGIQTEPFALYENGGTVLAKRKVKISNTIVQNCSGFGFYHRLYNVFAFNNLVLNCGQGLVNISLGGDYRYFHSTFANYYTKDNKRKEPSIYISNQGGGSVQDLDSAYFGNCIIAGNKVEELKIDSGSGKKMDYQFESCLLRTEINNVLTGYHYANNIKVIDPGIIMANTANSYDAHLKTNSQAIGNGKTKIGLRFPVDFDVITRPLTNPDIGAYQKQL
jgi:hypothetical protein